MNVEQAGLMLRAIARSGDDDALMSMMDILRSGEVTGKADSSALVLTTRMNAALALHTEGGSDGMCLECNYSSPCPTRKALLGVTTKKMKK
jgi:hypothetical protein